MPYPHYDSNRIFGRVLYVHGLLVDQPLAITRVNYADASDFHTGTVTWQVYAPFSIIPLWNSAGRGNRYVMGGTADPGGDYLCVDEDQYRCAEVGLDKGEFPYSRSGADASVWQGTVLVDKADATGTYYRRNRSYDPNTARFTQEDPIGLAGGMNLYGFAGGDPVNFSDPFGTTECKDLKLLAAVGCLLGIYSGRPHQVPLQNVVQEAGIDATQQIGALEEMTKLDPKDVEEAVKLGGKAVKKVAGAGGGKAIRRTAATVARSATADAGTAVGTAEAAESASIIGIPLMILTELLFPKALGGKGQPGQPSQ
jgi:RHS repeat-associated protein